MFNPSELEGEVDHAFFDSDCDSSSGHRRKNVEEILKAKKENPVAPERPNVKCTITTKDGLSPNNDESRKHLNGTESTNNNKASSRGRRKESSRWSNVSSASCTSHEVSTDSSDSENDFKVQDERPKRSLLALLAETRNVEDNDISSKSRNETEEETGTFSESSKKRNKHSSKKRARGRHTQSPPPSSTENSADADLDSSCSSNSRRSSFESPTLPKPTKASLCPEVRKSRVGSAVSQQGQTPPTDESDYTVTDVSPLSSPSSSPRQPLEPNHREAEESHQKEQLEEESVPSSGLSNIHEGDSDEDMDECSLSLESQLRDKLVLHYPGGRNRKNYSFTNDEVRRIDRENQRLLRELSRLSPGPRSGSAMTKKSHAATTSPLARLSHSALNRQRDQQRIERENLAFLKRLESVKPTPGLRRSEQLADYQRHAGYVGAPLYPICTSATRKERSKSRMSSAGTTSVSSRAASATNNSSTTPAPRPKKMSASRPAWC